MFKWNVDTWVSFLRNGLWGIHTQSFRMRSSNPVSAPEKIPAEISLGIYFKIQIIAYLYHWITSFRVTYDLCYTNRRNNSRHAILFYR